MADQSLEILIDIISRGGPAATEALKQVTQAAKDGSADAKKILDELAASEQKAVESIKRVASAKAEAHVQDFKAFQKAEAERKKNEPKEESEGMGYAMRRHFGAMAGQILGMPGLGLMAAVGGMAAGIGVATLALEKLVSKFNEWNESIAETARSSMAFDLIGTRIATLGTLTRQVSEHNKDLALSYSQIEHNVRTVSAEIAHLTEIQTVQLQFQQRLDDARLAREKAAIDLATRFDPIGRIRQTEAAEEAHYQRQMERERSLMQLRLQMHQHEAERAAEEEKRYTKEADALKAGLPEIQKKALEDKGKAEQVSVQNARKRDEMLKELELINEMALDKDAGGKWVLYRSFAPSHLNPSTKASDALLTNPNNAAKAAVRKAELEKQLQELNEATAAAEQVALGSQGKAERAQQAVTFSENKARGLNEERKKAQFEAEQDKSLLEGTQNMFRQEIDERKKSMQDRSTLQQFDAVQPISVPPSAGGASISNEAILERLDKLVLLQTKANSIWETSA